MKANELQIGDWVYYKGKMPCKITAICKDTAVVDNDTAQDWWIDYDKLTPIPLTAEILEKNWFGYKEEGDYLTHYYLGDRWYLDNPDLYIGTYNKSVYWLNYLDNAICGIKYVHQLQHALRLCGINKEIIL